jgi:hypothetical protein
MTNGESEMGRGILEITGAGADLASPLFFLDNFKADLIDVVGSTDFFKCKER